MTWIPTIIVTITGTTTDHTLAKESDMGDMDSDKYNDKKSDNYRNNNNSPYSRQSAMGSAARAAVRRGFDDSESKASNLSQYICIIFVNFVYFCNNMSVSSIIYVYFAAYNLDNLKLLLLPSP